MDEHWDQHADHEQEHDEQDNNEHAVRGLRRVGVSVLHRVILWLSHAPGQPARGVWKSWHLQWIGSMAVQAAGLTRPVHSAWIL